MIGFKFITILIMIWMLMLMLFMTFSFMRSVFNIFVILFIRNNDRLFFILIILFFRWFTNLLWNDRPIISMTERLGWFLRQSMCHHNKESTNQNSEFHIIYVVIIEYWGYKLFKNLKNISLLELLKLINSYD